ncbi:MAG: phosphatidate cytidylyltransferase, partial [SAR324 cluster bacterium]
MALAFVAALLAGKNAVIAVVGLVSCVALFEFLAQCGIRWREHKGLVSACFALAVIQYGLVAGDRIDLFFTVVPLAAFLVLPALAALLGDAKDILRVCGRTQWGLMISVYGMSHLPGIFLLHLGGTNDVGVLLVGYVVAEAQISDTMQYAFGKAFGRTLMSPTISPKKTVEGLVGGGMTAIVAGSALGSATPFDLWQAAALSTAIVASGILGGLVLSAIKRDVGIKDWGRLIPGHGGVLDRTD